MESSKDSKSQDSDVKSIFSMQELDPSPEEEEDLVSDLESGEFTPTPEEKKPNRTCGLSASKLGLRAYRWDALCMFESRRSELIRG